MNAEDAIHLRPASSEDVETVVQILSRSRRQYLPFARSPYSLDGDRKFVANRLIPAGHVVIAEFNDDEVGVLATSLEDGIAWIDQLYLAPGYIGKGIGGILLNQALQKLPRPVRLWTFQQNKRAIGFYEHHGFKPVKYTDGADNVEKCPDVLYELNQ